MHTLLLPTGETINISGCSFRELEFEAAFGPIEPGESKKIEDEILELVPEPDNPHDENAIKVMHEGHHLGYIPAYLAEDYAPMLSAAVSTDRFMVNAPRIHYRNKLVLNEQDQTFFATVHIDLAGPVEVGEFLAEDIERRARELEQKQQAEKAREEQEAQRQKEEEQKRRAAEKARKDEETKQRKEEARKQRAADAERKRQARQVEKQEAAQRRAESRPSSGVVWMIPAILSSLLLLPGLLSFKISVVIGSLIIFGIPAALLWRQYFRQKRRRQAWDQQRAV